MHDRLHVPANKYYLANAGFPICDALLIPKCGVQYHLAEWGWAKQCFHILVYPAEISMEYQACIPAALAAIHNFILISHSQLHPYP